MMTSSNGNIFRVTGHVFFVTGEFPTQRPVTQSFDVFFDLHLNKQFSKQSWGWCFEVPSRPLWHHGNAIHIYRSCNTRSLSYQFIISASLTTGQDRKALLSMINQEGHWKVWSSFNCKAPVLRIKWIHFQDACQSSTTNIIYRIHLGVRNSS